MGDQGVVPADEAPCPTTTTSQIAPLLATLPLRAKGSVNVESHSDLRDIGYAADDVVAEIAGISVIDRARGR